jgi:hypothetical protein
MSKPTATLPMQAGAFARTVRSPAATNKEGNVAELSTKVSG